MMSARYQRSSRAISQGFAILGLVGENSPKLTLNAPFNQAGEENRLTGLAAAMLGSFQSFPVSFGVLWPAASARMNPTLGNRVRRALALPCLSQLAWQALHHSFPLFPLLLNGSGCVLLIKTSSTLLLNPFKLQAG